MFINILLFAVLIIGFACIYRVKSHSLRITVREGLTWRADDDDDVDEGEAVDDEEGEAGEDDDEEEDGDDDAAAEKGEEEDEAVE